MLPTPHDAVANNNMKTLPLILCATVLCGLVATITPALGQGTAFTYQGQLNEAGAPANSRCDLTFTLYGATTGGNPVGAPQAVDNLAISNGLFTVTLDFGPGVFNGNPLWLEIAARPGATTNAFTILTPRQALTSVPYATFAAGVNGSGVRGPLPPGSLSGAYGNPVSLVNPGNLFMGDGSGLTHLLAANLIGPLAPAQVPPNVALLDAPTQSFTGVNTFTGTVGMHTGNPFMPLTVGGFGDNSDYLGFQDSEGVNRWHLTGIGGGLNFAETAIADFRLYLAPGGNLGIGNNLPADQLQIGSLNTLADQYLSIKTAGGNNFRAGLKFRHFADNGGFNIEDDERPNTNGLHIIRYPFGGPVSALFIDRFSGNVGIGKVNPATKLDVAGEITCTAVNITSDRNAKEVFEQVDPRAVLEKVMHLPITSWQYKSEPGARHLGPMAQDFHQAFALGRDERHITSVDEDGVALAAIQGLNQKLEEKEAELARLHSENQALADRLAAIERLLAVREKGPHSTR